MILFKVIGFIIFGVGLIYFGTTLLIPEYPGTMDQRIQELGVSLVVLVFGAIIFAVGKK